MSFHPHPKAYSFSPPTGFKLCPSRVLTGEHPLPPHRVWFAFTVVVSYNPREPRSFWESRSQGIMIVGKFYKVDLWFFVAGGRGDVYCICLETMWSNTLKWHACAEEGGVAWEWDAWVLITTGCLIGQGPLVQKLNPWRDFSLTN